MNLDRILPYTRTLLERAVKPGEVVIDATVGNGNDTLFLARLVGEHGRVYGFDVQQEAITETTSKLEEHELKNRVLLFNQGHETIEDTLPPVHYGAVAGAIFNLGYLPGSDETIVTRPRTTIAAVEQCLRVMRSGGMMILVIYHGHPEGAVERDYLLRYCEKIDGLEAQVLRYQFINTQTPSPFILAIEKK
ncbi:class I SAM-dependent methyltransferase [Jeotgalibacillus malaysiensis]|uniref:tRNA (mnm(5)s(2)U34)-methyltransferase n=1 Tax=Jeotgalibacillus malaysiensis TaxID=1508404 RepID=UPI00385152D3